MFDSGTKVVCQLMSVSKLKFCSMFKSENGIKMNASSLKTQFIIKNKR